MSHQVNTRIIMSDNTKIVSMYEKKYHEADISKLSFLVTGGAGFIGSNIVDYLMQHGAGKVRVLDNLSEGRKVNIEAHIGKPNFEFIEGDITDFDTCAKACEGIDLVTHQAALGSVPRSINNPVATNNVNITGFVNVITAAKDAGVKRFVYASSSSVYGDSKEMPKKEERIGKALSPYAVTKRANELYASVFADTYNMEIIGLRYFNIFGPKQNPKGAYAAVIPLFVDALLDNESPYINGDGEQSRDFTFVANAVQANIKALLTDNTEALGQVYNVALGGRVTINELFNNLKDLIGSSVNAIHRDNRPGDIRDSNADISKAEKYLGYNPEVGVKEGLEATLKWYIADRNTQKVG